MTLALRSLTKTLVRSLAAAVFGVSRADRVEYEYLTEFKIQSPWDEYQKFKLNVAAIFILVLFSVPIPLSAMGFDPAPAFVIYPTSAGSLDHHSNIVRTGGYIDQYSDNARERLLKKLSEIWSKR
ncbi:hypothetical protein EVAR_44443_1 [Eumeta japonica]|uniref:Uncharacterized protein n=1 Tax=Eumeta variegata TaxID=151549 RepID=A0A4C1WJ75_EUMVA|nr:hypothetical protein EVAR_44443_1 [Eumeta japonica]